MATVEDTAGDKRTSTAPPDEQPDAKKPNGDAKEADPPRRKGVIVDLVCPDADKFAGFAAKAIGAREYFRFADEKTGKIMHLAMSVGGISLFATDKGAPLENGPEAPYVMLTINCDDADALAAKMVEAGAKAEAPVETQFWGDKYGKYRDPFGQGWAITSPGGDNPPAQEDVPKDKRRTVAAFISVRDCAAYISWLEKVFGAKQLEPPAKTPDGKIMCAEMEVNGGVLMVSDHFDDSTEASAMISLEVKEGEASATAKAFEENGGSVKDPVAKMFWGQVWGTALDMNGQRFGIGEPRLSVPSDADMRADAVVGEKYGWRWHWSVKDAPALRVIGQTKTVEISDMASAMSEMIPAAHAHAGKAGLEVTGPPAALYHTFCMDKGGTKLTCGAQVAMGGGDKEEGGEFAAHEALGVPCIYSAHKGPYTDLPKAWSALFEWAKEKGLDFSMPAVEVYVNSPKEVTDPAKLETHLYVAVKGPAAPAT